MRTGADHPVDRSLVWLAAITALALAARLVGIRHGLPHVYNADEELHFVPFAAAAADGDWAPGYYDNPSGLTYLLAVVFRTVLPGNDDTTLLEDDPALVFTVARLVVAVLGTASVLAVALVGRRAFGPSAGNWAAALVGLSFLPVFYAHYALNDAATLLPLALGLLACLTLLERGGTVTAALAGVAIGVAAGTKYTAAPMCVVLALALLFRVLDGRQRLRPALRDLAVAAGGSLVGLLALNPFLLLDARTSWGQLAQQSAQAATPKLGQIGSAWAGYPATLLWGLGVVPVLLGAAGLVLGWRRDWRTTVLLMAFPVLLYLSMATHERWFARWMLPAYPALAVLAGHGAARAVAAVERWFHVAGRARATVLATVLVAAVALGQPVADVTRNDLVLLRTDTRTEALVHLLEEPAASRIVVEPGPPASYLGDLEDARWELYPVHRPFQRYEADLDPGLLETYRTGGWCWVMVNEHQRGRGLAAGLPGAERYYRRLQAEADRVLVVSPYDRGADPVPFSYDLSFNYYPFAYHRPGPVVVLYRLDDCGPPIR